MSFRFTALSTQQPRNSINKCSASIRQASSLIALLSFAVGCAGIPDDAQSNEDVASSDQAVSRPDLPYPVLDPVVSKPIPYLDPNDLIEITAGGYHTCVRKRNGNVYCWGLDSLGQVGRLPNATCSAAPNKCVDRPSRVFTGGGFVSATAVDAGFDHTCALDNQGKAYCWGSSNYGQLGMGPGLYGYQSEPIAVSGSLTFTSVTAGTYNTCGTTASGLFCWGNGLTSAAGTMGRGPFPQQVFSATGLAPTGASVGEQHVCMQFVSGTFRETDCFGGNLFGQSGSPASRFAALGLGPSSVGTAVSSVVTQHNFTCVNRPDPSPSVQCFGNNSYGKLGNGTTTDASTAQTVGGTTATGAPLLALRGVSTGNNHACALDGAGNAYCWGNGYSGQLGNGSSAVSSSPVLVAGSLTFRRIAAGTMHTCAIGTDNTVYCWGSNTSGQLGTQYKSSGTYTDGWVSTPVRTQTFRE